MIPKVGDRIPDFTLPAGSREGRGAFTLAAALENGPLVISFYPLAFTGVCTKQVCEGRDRFAELAEIGARVVGFSTDTMPANVAFAERHDIPYPLVSDANREVVHRIWETTTVLGVKDVPKRGVLVLAEDATVLHVRVHEAAGDWDGFDDVARVLAAHRGA